MKSIKNYFLIRLIDNAFSLNILVPYPAYIHLLGFIFFKTASLIIAGIIYFQKIPFI